MLESDTYRAEIEATVAQMHDLGIHAIPVLIFDVLDAGGAGVPRPVADKGSVVHRGSGSVADFRGIFEQLHAASLAAI